MPTTENIETAETNSSNKTNKTAEGKAIAARNATTHGLFARDVVLPHLGEDPAGYQTLADELAKQLAPQNLLEHHYVEKIAAASWRLRRLQRWQAQLYEDDTLAEDELLNRLDKTLRHETALHRQIDTAVKLLARDVPNLYARRVRARVLEDAMLSERECAECLEDDAAISMEVCNRLGRIRKATDLALPRLAAAPLDTLPSNNTEICQNELQAEPAPAPPALAPNPPLTGEGARHEREGSGCEICQNEPTDEPAPVIEVDPRTHPAFLGMNEVPRPLPYAALHRREDHRVIHAAARAQSHLFARQRDEPPY